MGFRELKSGRRVLTTLRDSVGRPKYYEVLDEATNTTRAVSTGPSILEIELPGVIEFFMEEDQLFWTWPQASSKKLIHLANAFLWCAPQVGDQLFDFRTEEVFTVKHVPEGRDVIPWNGLVYLDHAPGPNQELMWRGDAKERNLIAFKEEDSSPDTPTPGEDIPGADTGVALSQVVMPTVTYLMKTQRPGSIGAKPFGQRTQPKPRLRELFVDPESPQHTVMISGWWMDSIFEFIAWHPRALVASHLARWFRDFMQRNIPSLKINGINEILFWSQDDVKRRSRGFDAAGRAVQYYFRLEELEVRRESNIRHIDLNVGVSWTTEAEEQGITSRGEWLAPNPYTGSFYDESGNYLPMTLDIADTATGLAQ